MKLAQEERRGREGFFYVDTRVFFSGHHSCSPSYCSRTAAAAHAILFEKRRHGKCGTRSLFAFTQFAIFKELFAFMCAIHTNHNRLSTLPTMRIQPILHIQKALSNTSTCIGEIKFSRRCSKFEDDYHQVCRDFAFSLFYP